MPPTKLCVPESWRPRLADWARSEGLSLELGGAQDAGTRLLEGAERRAACTEDTLYVGGSIACPQARAQARRLGLPFGKFGALLDLLEIKVKDCELGCF